MQNWLVYSHVALWVLLVVESLVLVSVLRQVGVLLLRIGPRTALNLASMGPEVGQPAPDLPEDVEGRDVSLTLTGHEGRTDMAETLLVFSSPTCGSCSMIPPSLSSLAASYNEVRFCVVASGKRDVVLDYRHRFPKRVYLIPDDGSISTAYKATNSPYAVFIDRNGLVRLKGIVNDREQLEDLLQRGLSHRGRRGKKAVASVRQGAHAG